LIIVHASVCLLRAPATNEVVSGYTIHSIITTIMTRQIPITQYGQMTSRCSQALPFQ
jgi:hypothetical protein